MKKHPLAWTTAAAALILGAGIVALFNGWPPIAFSAMIALLIYVIGLIAIANEWQASDVRRGIRRLKHRVRVAEIKACEG